MSKTLIEEALALEGVEGIAAELVKSIYQQESGGGANSKTSNRGAVGGMQILPTTFNGVADEGWDIKNPLDNARAGVRYVLEGLQKGGGDPKLAAAYYYGGPNGLKKAAQGEAVFDSKNPNAPSTLQYADQVTSRMGLSSEKENSKERGEYLGLVSELGSQSTRPTTQPYSKDRGEYLGLVSELYPQQKEKPAAAKQEEKGFFENFGALAKQGFDSAVAGGRIADDVATGNIDDNSASIITGQLNKKDIAPKELKEVQAEMARTSKEGAEAGSFTENPIGNMKAFGNMLYGIGEQLITNPKGVAYMTAEQLANMAPSIVGMISGAKAGGAAGAIAAPVTGGLSVPIGAAVGGFGGAFAGEWQMEAGSQFIGSIGKELQARGLKPTEENVTALLSDQKLREKIISESRSKATVTSAVDSLFTLGAGRLVSAPARAAQKQAIKELGEAATKEAIEQRAKSIIAERTFTQKIANGGKALALDVTGGGASEAAGQQYAYGDVDLGEVQGEILGEIGGAGIEIPAASYAVGRDTYQSGRDKLLAQKAEKEAARKEQQTNADAAIAAMPKAQSVDDAIALATEAINTPIEESFNDLTDESIDLNDVLGDENVSDTAESVVTGLDSQAAAQGVDNTQGSAGDSILVDEQSAGVGDNAGTLGGSGSGDISLGTGNAQDGAVSEPLGNSEQLPNEVVGNADNVKTGQRLVDLSGKQKEVWFNRVDNETGKVILDVVFNDRGKKRQDEMRIDANVYADRFMPAKDDKDALSKFNQLKNTTSLGGRTNQESRNILEQAEQLSATPQPTTLDNAQSLPAVQKPLSQKPKKTISKKSNTLNTRLIDLGGVQISDKSDISGESGRGIAVGYNRVFRKDSRASLKGHIENGDLDDYLPPAMRLSSSTMQGEAYDSTDAYDYLADRIRNGDRVLPYDVEEEIKANQFYQQHQAQDIPDGNGINDDEINKLLSEAGYDERERDAENRIYGQGNIDQVSEITEQGNADSNIVSAEREQARGTGTSGIKTTSPIENAGQVRANPQVAEKTREVITQLVKLRKNAQQISKEEEFDEVLKAAKAMMEGKEVKSSTFKSAFDSFERKPDDVEQNGLTYKQQLKMIKYDEPIAKLLNELHEISKPIESAAKVKRQFTFAKYKKNINDATSADDLYAIARQMAKDSAFDDNDAKYVELNALIDARVDALELDVENVATNDTPQERVDENADDRQDFTLTGETEAEIQAKEKAKKAEEEAQAKAEKDAQAEKDKKAAEEAQRKNAGERPFVFGEDDAIVKRDVKAGVDDMFTQQEAIEAIKQDETIPTADKIKLAADLRRGDVNAEDVSAIVGEQTQNAPKKKQTEFKPLDSKGMWKALNKLGYPNRDLSSKERRVTINQDAIFPKDRFEIDIELKGDKWSIFEIGVPDTMTIEQIDAMTKFRSDLAELNGEAKPSQENDTNIGGKPMFSRAGSVQIQNKSSVTENGVTFKTGVPVTFTYAHNTESATKIFGKPTKDSPYGRGFEPSGQYVTAIDNIPERKSDRYEYGTITFNNPLVIENDGLNWKKSLSDTFGGLTGKKLSLAIINAGYDGVVTTDGKYTSEILNLTNFDEGKALFSRVMPDDDRSLITQHNISADGLANADRVGGLAVPSLAVVKKDLALENFGEITLLASKDLIDPRGGNKAKVFGADIYSPRYPDVINFFDRRNIKAFQEKFADSFKAVDENEISESDLDSNPINKLRDSTAIRHYFLKGKGIEPNVVKKELSAEDKQMLSSKFLKPFITDKIDVYELPKNKEFADAYYNYIKEKRDLNGDRTVNFDDEQKYNLAKDGVYDLREVVEKRSKNADRYATREAIRKQFDVKLNNEYETFIQSVLAGLNPSEKLFNGYTNSGNRRYIEHTLDNVVKLLKKDIRGGENWNYGLGSVRAMFTPEFKSIADIKKNKDRLISNEQFEAVKQEQDDELMALSEKLQPYHPAFADGKYGFLDSMTSMLSDAAKRGIPRALKEGGFDEVPNDLMVEIGSFLNQLRNMPTEYFEAKILRDVKLGEFSAAVVPKGARQDTLDILKKHGITDIKFYDDNNAQDRQRAISSFDNLMFSRDSAFKRPQSLYDQLFGVPDELKQRVMDGAQRTVDAIRANWENAPDVEVVYDMDDERIRKVVRDENERQLSQGATGAPEGFFDDGKVYIVAGALKTPQDVARVLLHESLGHYGLRGTFGKDLTKILDQVASLKKNVVHAKAKQYGLAFTQGEAVEKVQAWAQENEFELTSQEIANRAKDLLESDRLIAAEEVLAQMAQDTPEIGFVKRAIAAIRNWLRANVSYFKDMKLSDDDIIEAYILPARNYVVNGGANGLLNSDGARYSLSNYIQSATSKWSDLIDKYIGNQLDKSKVFELFDTTPASMQVIGMPNLPVKISSHSIDYVNERFTEQQLKQLPVELSDPVLAYVADDTKTGGVSANFVTSIKSNNGKVVVAVKPNANHPVAGKSNYIATMMVIPDGVIEAKLRQGRALYVGDLSAEQRYKSAIDKAAKEKGTESVNLRKTFLQAFGSQRPNIRIMRKSDAVNMIAKGDAKLSRSTLPDTITVDGKQRPTLNSNGKPIHPTREGVENFWRWFSPSPSQLLDGLSVAEVSSIKRNAESLSDFIESQSRLPKSDSFSVIPTPVFSHMSGVVSNSKILDAVVRTLPIDVVNFLERKQFSAKEVLHNPSMLKDVLSINGSSDVSLGINPSVATNILMRVIANAGAKVTSLTNGALERNAAMLADANNPIFGTHVKKSPYKDLSIIAGFGDSKVIDADGKPLAVYHGTDKNFNTFDKSQKGIMRVLFSEFDVQRNGFFFATSEDGAQNFGKNIIPAFLSIKKPADFTNIKIDKELIEAGLDKNDLDTEFGNVWELFDDERGSRVVSKLKELGYDGVKFLEDGAEEGMEQVLSYMAFEPNQIKSATQNTGDFNPANPSILFSRSSNNERIIGDSEREYTPAQLKALERTGSVVKRKTFAEKWDDVKRDLGKKLAQGLADQFRPIKDISSNAYTLLRLSKGASGAMEALMNYGKLSIKDGAFDADTSGGVLDKVFRPIGKEATDFLRWVAGNRAERLAKAGLERLFTDEDIAAFKSLSEGTTGFDYTLRDGTVTRDRTKIYADTLTKFNEFNKNVLDMAEQSGLIDGNSRKLWEHEFYVPFYRLNDDDPAGVRGMNIKKGVVRQEAFKKLKGGDAQLNDLMSNVLMNWHHLIDASAKNRAAMATVKAAENVGIATPTDAGGKNTVWFMENGEKKHFYITEPDVMDALVGLEFAGMRNFAMDAMSKTKHMLTIGVTASPFFKVRNLIRDSVQAIATSDLSYNPLGNVKQGWQLTDKSDGANQTYVSALAGGGLIRFGTMTDGNEAAHVRRLIKSGVRDEALLNSEGKLKDFWNRKIIPVVEAYNELGNRGEGVNRMALYDQLIKKGIPHSEASLMARDLMDFSMQGSWTAVRFLTQIVPFMNARIQGMYKLGRSATGSKESAAKMAIVTGAVTLVSLALLAAYGDDDDWKKREEWDRDNYWWFKVGGIAYRIPKPFEVGAVATLGERMAELVFDDEMTKERFAKVVLELTSNQLSMNPIPQAVKPIIDVYSNKDSFTGRDIESMSMERLAPDYRFNANTSYPARAISTAGNTLTGDNFLSPLQVDHLIHGYFGWLGSFIVGGADLVARGASDEPKRATLDYFKLATGGMASKIEGSHSRYVTQVYDQAKELEQSYNTYRALLREGKKEDAAEYLSDNREDIAKYRNVEGVKKQMSFFQKAIKNIEKSESLSADEKRVKINALMARQEAAARRLYVN